MHLRDLSSHFGNPQIFPFRPNDWIRDEVFYEGSGRVPERCKSSLARRFVTLVGSVATHMSSFTAWYWSRQLPGLHNSIHGRTQQFGAPKPQSRRTSAITPGLESHRKKTVN